MILLSCLSPLIYAEKTGLALTHQPWTNSDDTDNQSNLCATRQFPPGPDQRDGAECVWSFLLREILFWFFRGGEAPGVPTIPILPIDSAHQHYRQPDAYQSERQPAPAV